jgi:hypothetical protein
MIHQGCRWEHIDIEVAWRNWLQDANNKNIKALALDHLLGYLASQELHNFQRKSMHS